MMTWMALLACGEPEGVRSRPVSPTVTFETQPQGIVWTDLVPLFPQQKVSLPSTLAALRPGMDAASARAILDAAKQPGVKILSQKIEAHTALGTQLAGASDLGVTLILDEAGALSAVNLSLPDNVALSLLVDRWGEPSRSEMGDGAIGRYSWADGSQPWQATLMPDPDKKVAIIEFTPAG